jgi:hypothetical protein
MEALKGRAGRGGWGLFGEGGKGGAQNLGTDGAQRGRGEPGKKGRAKKGDKIISEFVAHFFENLEILITMNSLYKVVEICLGNSQLVKL